MNPAFTIGIRNIESNSLRRLLMIILFVPVLVIVLVFNFILFTVNYLFSIGRATYTLSYSIIEFWNNPEDPK